ncbi:MAG TPA: cytochrome c oxidase subunit II [Xanthobacteraceae bacterium]|jgi:cytochrome c oxidase subunit 2
MTQLRHGRHPQTRSSILPPRPDRKTWVSSGIAALFTTLLPCAARAQDQLPISHGLSYLTAFGPKNYSVVTLLYAVIIISLVVMTIVGVLVLFGSLLRGARPVDGNIASVPIERSGSGLLFIYIGAAVSFVVLLAVAVWNYVVLAAIAAPPANAAATIHVTGHQWWWEVQYESSEPSRTFTTANEIHIPVGKPVKVELSTADVIHSFWVPALSGKMDTIPGQHNVTWLQADKPGVYRGQCTEYCGQQHAHMGLLVIADPPDRFDAWWQNELEGPDQVHVNVPAADAREGQTVFMRHCAACHAVRGTMAMGKVGPDLSHLMERRSLAAGAVPNTVGALSGWISDPQRIKPGNYMPTLTLSAAELSKLRDFLRTLR